MTMKEEREEEWVHVTVPYNDDVRGVQFSFETCPELPVVGFRSLVEVKEKVMWGSERTAFVLDEPEGWKKVSDLKNVWSSLSVKNGQLVAIGGLADGVCCSTEVVVWNEKQWSSMTHMLVGCCRSCVVSDGVGGLLVMGGNNAFCGDLDVVQWFDVESQTWFYGPSLPKPSCKMSAAIHDGVVYLMGGGGMDCCVWSSNIIQLKTKRVRPPTGASVWRKLPEVPCKGSSACVVDGVLLAIGGRDQQSKRTSTIYAFHIAENKWQLVGNLPFECQCPDSLLLSNGEPLVVDGNGKKALKLKVKGLSDANDQTTNEKQVNIDTHPRGEHLHSDGDGYRLSKTPDITFLKDKCTDDLEMKLAIERNRANRAEQRAIVAEATLQQQMRTSDKTIAHLRMQCLELQNQQSQPSTPHWVVEVEEVEMTNEELGRGGWAVVKLAIFRGLKVAAKCPYSEVISKYNEGVFTREMNIAARTCHPNLVQFIGATIQGHPIILTELMSTSVRSVLVTRPLSYPEVLSIGTDVASALNYLHLIRPDPIIHCDVSSANVLLEPTGPCSWKAKLSDFGSVNYLRYSNTEGAGNPMYCAPESKDPEKHSPKLDVYSYGVLLLEMCTRKLPDDIPSLLLEVKRLSILPLLTDCLKEDPNLRLSMKEVLSRLDNL